MYLEFKEQVELLLQEMERLGTRGSDGKLKCKFGDLIKDDRCSNIFEVRESCSKLWKES
jgi:hypothetical protein